MGLGPELDPVEALENAGESKGKKRKKKKKDEAMGGNGCWVNLRFVGSCFSKPEVDSSISNSSIRYALKTLEEKSNQYITERESMDEVIRWYDSVLGFRTEGGEGVDLAAATPRDSHPTAVEGGASAESKSTNDGSRDQLAVPVVSGSTTTSNAESSVSTPKVGEGLKVASQLRKFTFNELKSATSNFRPDSLLGQGGFGCVFKGWIEENGTAPVKPGTGLTVAVKTLNHDGLQGHKEWLAEVNFLGDLLHPNLVKLIGYCIEDDHRLLAYEFMPRGSLENHLFRRSLPLPWSVRMKIALGAAKGLAFLHEEAERPVIYRDFKTSNILLDAEYNAKLSDFGLAKDGPEGDKTHVSTRVMGTFGYAAPEYVMTGHLTSKSDVYSFGVVLLEMLTGRRSMDKNRPNGEHNLVEWARPHLGERRRFYRLLDPRLEGHFSIKGAQKATQLAQRCLTRDSKARPLMSEVVEALRPLLNLKDMASSSHSFQSMQAERAAAASANNNPNARNGLKTHGSFARNGQQPLRSLSNAPQASPHHRPQKASGKRT